MRPKFVIGDVVVYQNFEGRITRRAITFWDEQYAKVYVYEIEELDFWVPEYELSARVYKEEA
jgi:hypothetical protein